jgi:hypothetical protein
MKHLCMTVLCFFAVVVCGKSQTINVTSDTIRVILENEKLIVTEYSSTPGKDICGKGEHYHNPHLSILLTDAKATLIAPDGKTQDFDMKAGTTFWSEAETHIVINGGTKPAKVYIVEMK